MLNIKGREIYFADLHIHSRFSRACSKDLNLETLAKWGKIKGIDLIGTGDFTHPIWIEELRNNLKEVNKSGIFENKDGFKFILTSEISLIYTQERCRRVHLIMLAPSFEAVDKINAWLDTKGRRDYDGRPIFKISCEDFAKKMHEIDENIEVIPAHIWTPHFGALGSKSGFDSLKEAFGNQINLIHAIETGISSTPEMNLTIPEIKSRNLSIVSFSDTHSYWPWRLGREATLFYNLDSYELILKQIRENEIAGTVEVNPAYGKYHYDGHRNCNFSCSPSETKKLNGICPICHKKLLIGVENRVIELSESKINISQRKLDFFGNKKKNNVVHDEKNNLSDKYKDKIVFEMLPLHEVISLYVKKGVNTNSVWEIYNKLIEKFESEFNILINANLEELEKVIDKDLAKLIILNRDNKIKVKPGFDGNYGEAEI